MPDRFHLGTSIPKEARVAVYDAPNGDFRLADYPLRLPSTGEVLVKVKMCTICRSDIHSWQGHRPNACPALLGHEIIGTIAALGEGTIRDLRDNPLVVGDRITWSEYFVPERTFLSEVCGLPQKSPGVAKYGHMSADEAPHHHGGFAEYCYVLQNSWIARLPDILTDEEATPINCGVATMCAAIDAADVRFGDTVLIQGLGLLGIYGAAMAKARGARRVIGVDSVPSRRDMAKRFGVDDFFEAGESSPEPVRNRLRVDVAIEVCGQAAAIHQGVAALRPGGRYVLAGLVNPDAMITLDANLLLKKHLTVAGVHNYHPRHLLQAVDFVVANRGRFPFHELVDGHYPLEHVAEAMADAAERRVLRAAVSP
ncbi:zinc-binding dehydrogenase [Propionivibrio soli]|uniref:zinc-binding dehydrogenase n=1 Tax=Propionivibrio soli TaxID=2976531 RepID=UPI0021E741A4|nr:zinc-binding dehydrogenase [Propionivibrio soli]